MNPYADEDVMWQRLKDMQREAENRRLIRAGAGPAAKDVFKMLAARAWLIAGLAMRRPPRRTWTDTCAEAKDVASRAA
jgi:hypothetical protein